MVRQNTINNPSPSPRPNPNHNGCVGWYDKTQVFSAMSDFRIDVGNSPGSQTLEYIPSALSWPLGGDPFALVAAGANHVVALTLRGVMYQWGFILGHIPMYPERVEVAGSPIIRKVVFGLYQSNPDPNLNLNLDPHPNPNPNPNHPRSCMRSISI